MFFAKSLITALAAVTSAMAITINTPSPSSFWVQNTSNIISWSFNSGDPNPIDITVSNSNSSFLNGDFSIARFVNLTNGTFTVTNVTLVVASGYVVNFVNTTNGSQVFASSQSFDVKAPGTAPATVSSAAPSSTATSPSNGTASGSGTASGTSSTASGTSSSSAAFRNFGSDFSVLPVAMSGAMVIVGALLTL